MQTPATATPAATPFGKDCVIIDVRTGIEHAGVALRQPHHHIPLDTFDAAAFLKEKNIPVGQTVYTLCRSGKRATQAAEALISAGHADVRVIEGGIIACEAAGIPVRKRETVSLERQVRIAAGLLVTLGVALGASVSPWFYGLSAFVGCGLVFAGVTDSCGMAFVLARAPWNRQAAQQDAPACGIRATCAATAAVSEAPAMAMPEDGVSYYSPANGKPAPLANIRALTKTGTPAGGCS